MARRSVEWQGNAESNATYGFGVVGQTSIVPTTTFEAYTNPTIIRLEGCLNFQLDRTLDEPPLSSQVISYHVGILVHHEDIPVANLSPLSKQGLDWLWTCSGRIVMPVRFVGANLQDAPIALTQFHHIDSRAMRKVREDHKLSLLVFPLAIAGGDSLELTYNLRVLVKD